MLVAVFFASLAVTLALGPLPHLTQLADYPKLIEEKHAGPMESSQAVERAKQPSPDNKAALNPTTQEKGWREKLVTNPQDTFALVLSIFTAVLIGVGIWQGIHMRGQVRQARMQVRRLRETIQTMRNAEQRDLWAYVVVKDMGIINVAGTPPTAIPGQPPPDLRAFVVNPRTGPIASVTLTNAGRTPARRVQIIAAIHLQEYPISTPLPPLNLVGPKQVSVLGPGIGANAARQMPNPLTTQEVANLQDGTAAIYLYGTITYVDAYDIDRCTDFRLMYHAVGGTIGINTLLNFCEDGNDLT